MAEEYVHTRDTATFRRGNDVVRRSLYANHAVPSALAMLEGHDKLMSKCALAVSYARSGGIDGS